MVNTLNQLEAVFCIIPMEVVDQIQLDWHEYMMHIDHTVCDNIIDSYTKECFI